MKKIWLETLGKMTYGIYVLTACFEGTINGMIASWVSQASYDPPLVMVAVHPHRYSHELIQKSGHFALHLLSRDQKALLSRFKGPDPKAKFASIKWTEGQTGCPILMECLGYAECVVRHTYAPGNHTLFVGEMVGANIFSHEEPMSTLDYDGVYIGMR
ncbi:MAG: flavin reductase family protein [Pseudomonadota bacterium]